jgi:hypothetical protein
MDGCGQPFGHEHWMVHSGSVNSQVYKGIVQGIFLSLMIAL